MGLCATLGAVVFPFGGVFSDLGIQGTCSFGEFPLKIVGLIPARPDAFLLITFHLV